MNATEIILNPDPLTSSSRLDPLLELIAIVFLNTCLVVLSRIIAYTIESYMSPFFCSFGNELHIAKNYKITISEYVGTFHVLLSLGFLLALFELCYCLEWIPWYFVHPYLRIIIHATSSVPFEFRYGISDLVTVIVYRYLFKLLK